MTSLLTITQAAAELQVSARTVRRLVETGALPSIRLGRLVRIAPDDLAVLILETTGVHQDANSNNHLSVTGRA